MIISIISLVFCIRVEAVIRCRVSWAFVSNLYHQLREFRFQTTFQNNIISRHIFAYAYCAATYAYAYCAFRLLTVLTKHH